MTKKGNDFYKHYGEWASWFAWKPVPVGTHYVWFKKVLRRTVSKDYGDYFNNGTKRWYEYKELDK